MKRAASVIAICSALFAAGAAQSQALGAEVKTTCTRGGDARIIEVISPGKVGQSCDVRYTRGASNVSVPYHADNSDTFCNTKAQELVQNLSSAGFSCSTPAPGLRAETSTAVSDYVVEARREEPAPQAPAKTQALEPEPVIVTEVAQPAPQETQLAAAEQAAAAPAAAASAAEIMEPALAAVAEEPADKIAALEDEMSQILEQPPLEAASGEPAQLVASQAEIPAARPQPESIGRLVGAAPETRQAATPVLQAALPVSAPAEEPSAPAAKEKEAVAPAAQEPAAVQEAAPTPAPTPAAQPEAAASVKTQLRTPREVVRATLMAQAAAWNEGDLDGFMNGYWKSDELKFVSGVNITKGWSATQKRYRDRYAGGEGLGQLSFDNIDVKMITDDVAVTTGRFNLDHNGETSTGVFSLVLRRDDGAWRIVHDHTSPDPGAN